MRKYISLYWVIAAMYKVALGDNFDFVVGVEIGVAVPNDDLLYTCSAGNKGFTDLTIITYANDGTLSLPINHVVNYFATTGDQSWAVRFGDCLSLLSMLMLQFGFIPVVTYDPATDKFTVSLLTRGRGYATFLTFPKVATKSGWLESSITIPRNIRVKEQAAYLNYYATTLNVTPDTQFDVDIPCDFITTASATPLGVVRFFSAGFLEFTAVAFYNYSTPGWETISQGIVHTTGEISVLSFLRGTVSADTINRTVGSFIQDGFVAGDYLLIVTTGGDASCSGLVAASVSALTLTLTTTGTLVTETAAHAGASTVSAYHDTVIFLEALCKYYQNRWMIIKKMITRTYATIQAIESTVTSHTKIHFGKLTKIHDGESEKTYYANEVTKSVENNDLTVQWIEQ